MGAVIPQSFFTFISASEFSIMILSAFKFWSSTACIRGVHPRAECSSGNLLIRMWRAFRLLTCTAYVAGQLLSDYIFCRHSSQWLSMASVRLLQHFSIEVKGINIHILSSIRFTVCSSCSAICATSSSSYVFFSTAWSSSRYFCEICARSYAVYDYLFCARN